jgi:hypothetical protein
MEGARSDRETILTCVNRSWREPLVTNTGFLFIKRAALQFTAEPFMLLPGNTMAEGGL